MTTIYLIRHAEAEGNLFRRAQGHWNGKITERGKKQIDALAERFKDVHIDAVYSSDLDRARDTAGALLRGQGLEAAVRRAAGYIYHAMEITNAVGSEPRMGVQFEKNLWELADAE